MHAKHLIVAAFAGAAAAFPMMESQSISTLQDASLVAARELVPPQNHRFEAPGHADRRSPCPMLNAAANHGYLPRNGLAIDMATLKAGLSAAVNLAPDATELAGNKGLEAGNGTHFNLDDLAKHGILEHDGSLSRQDVAIGDNLHFNPTIWATFLANLPDPTISLTQAATALKKRHQAAAIANPSFNMTAGELTNSFIETSLYQSVFGQGSDGGARLDWVRTLFERERLPFEQGWKRSNSELSTSLVLVLVNKVGTLYQSV